MKSIGFVDFYIDEWHSNNYPAWIKKACEKLGLDFEVKYAWAEIDASPISNVTTDEWCEKMGVARCKTIDELCEKSDAIFILSPSNPEKHLKYAKEVFKYGKPTYVDKTFAENLETAKKIQEEAKKYNTPFFSTSALRYADELPIFADATNLFISFGGRSLEEYVIHPIEIAVVNKNADVTRVKVEEIGKMKTVYAETKRGSSLMFSYASTLPFVVGAEYDGKIGSSRRIESSFFVTLLEKIVEFFSCGVAPFEFEQTLSAIRFRDLVLKAEKDIGKWVCEE